MADPPTARPAETPDRTQRCRFCKTARVRIFRDPQGRAWVFNADAISDERTKEFCTDPPREVYVLHFERAVDRDAAEGRRRVRITGWVKPAADCAPHVVRDATYLLRLHQCAEWLTDRARRRREWVDAKLLGNMSAIGVTAAELLGPDQVDDVDDADRYDGP